MKKKHKLYSKPKRPFDKKRLEEESIIKKRFGLKNKKEIWKAETQIKSMKRKAKNLLSAEESEQKKLFEKMRKIGLKVNSIADILALEKEDYLARRLQTILFTKKLAPTIKSARQIITHKKTMVNKQIINKPSYIVPLEFEDKITIKQLKTKEEKNVTKTERESQ